MGSFPYVAVLAVESGFLNRGIDSRDQSVVGTWYPGWAISAIPGLFGVLLLIRGRSIIDERRKPPGRLVAAGAVILFLAWSFCLLGAAVRAYEQLLYTAPEVFAVLFIVVTLGVLGAITFSFRTIRRGPGIRRRWLYGLRAFAQLLLLYLAGLNTLMFWQGVTPFVGFFLATAGAVALWVSVHRPLRVAASRTPSG